VRLDTVATAASDPERRTCALRYAVGISVLQVGWIARLALPEGAGLAGFFGRLGFAEWGRRPGWIVMSADDERDEVVLGAEL